MAYAVRLNAEEPEQHRNKTVEAGFFQVGEDWIVFYTDNAQGSLPVAAFPTEVVLSVLQTT